MGCLPVSAATAAGDLEAEATAKFSADSLLVAGGGAQTAIVVSLPSNSSSLTTSSNIDKPLRILSGTRARLAVADASSATGGSSLFPDAEKNLTAALFAAYPNDEEYRVYPSKVFLGYSSGAAVAGYVVESLSAKTATTASFHYSFVLTEVLGRDALLGDFLADAKLLKIQPLSSTSIAAVYDVSMPYRILANVQLKSSASSSVANLATSTVTWLKDVNEAALQRGLVRRQGDALRFLRTDFLLRRFQGVQYEFTSIH
ncbi:unnamed protein product [Amoebophrya sp. A25]|nr:unnamed protein product [Amoebophrya sp. A25]|eukprot:GSA25T00016620001.1